MARYIDADIATKLMIQWADQETNDDIRHGYHNCQVIIYDMPTADVRENVKGEWTDHRTWEHDGEFYCSNCGFVLDSYIQGAFYNYCPHCGADMRGD